ncbi:MAG: hypothetical protein JJU29_11215 [Verrucomicrobia bacterium]|nr:hypothetical protein [Verrucomicrobiota bacterium]MCH8512827.1 hypothetical protein [Kiritimatiellia bacterium]
MNIVFKIMRFYPHGLLLLAFSVWVFLVMQLPGMKFQTGWTDQLQSTAGLVHEKQVVDDFLGGSKEYSSFFLYSESPMGVFSDSFLDAFSFLVASVEDSGFFEIESLKSLAHLRAVDFSTGHIDSRAFIDLDFPPESPGEWAEVRRRIELASFLNGFLVNPDLSGFALIATYLEDPEDRIRVFEWQREMQETFRQDFGLHLDILDDVYLNASLDVRAIRETVVWPGIAAVTIALVCFLLCGKKLKHVSGFFLLAFLSLCSLFGLISWLGYPYSIIFVFIPILLIITAGSDYPYFALLDTGLSPKDMFQRLRVPIALASVTTAISSFSLARSEIDQIRQFGIVAGCGVLLTSFYSLSVLPVYFSWVNQRWGVAGRSAVVQTSVPGIVLWWERFSSSTKGKVTGLFLFALGTVSVVPFAVLLPWTDDVVVDYFDPSDPVVRAAERAGTEFGGIDYLKVLVRDDEGFRSLENLNRLEAFQVGIRNLAYLPLGGADRTMALLDVMSGESKGGGESPAFLLKVCDFYDQWVQMREPRVYQDQVVSRVLSIVDLVSYVYQQLQGLEQPSLPESQAVTDYLMDNFLGDSLHAFQDDLFNQDFTEVTLDVFISSSDTRLAEQVVSGVHLLAASHGFEVWVGGYNVKWLNYKQHIVGLKFSGIFGILTVVGLLVCVCFFALTRRWFVGLFSGFAITAVVGVTVIWLLAAMSVFGIQLNIATATVMAIGIGISVNFSVHLFFALLKSNRFRDCGHTLRSLATDLATSSCFLFLAGSRLASLRHTGVLISVSVFLAFVFSVFLLPLLFTRSFYGTLKGK